MHGYKWPINCTRTRIARRAQLAPQRLRRVVAVSAGGVARVPLARRRGRAIGRLDLQLPWQCARVRGAQLALPRPVRSAVLRADNI